MLSAQTMSERWTKSEGNLGKHRLGQRCSFHDHSRIVYIFMLFLLLFVPSAPCFGGAGEQRLLAGEERESLHVLWS